MFMFKFMFMKIVPRAVKCLGRNFVFGALDRADGDRQDLAFLNLLCDGDLNLSGRERVYVDEAIRMRSTETAASLPAAAVSETFMTAM